tara:strand:- start:1111 stop:1536 length:426 start_codon:yes stop_codon:yes gene_type:complete
MNKNSLKMLRNLFLLVILIVVVRLIVLMLRIYLKKGENFRNKEGLYISPDSKIHGKGLFTDRSIEKEEFIFKAINEDKSITHYGQHINHQKEPNTKLKEENGEYNIYSTKSIKKGEELTTDYDDTPSFISKSNPEWNKIKK